MSRPRHPDHFGDYLGYTFRGDVGPDALPIMEMTIEEKHLSSAGVAHGGAVFSLVDFALGACLFTRFENPNQSCSTVGLQIEYLAPIPLGTKLTVTAYIEHRGRSLVRIRGDVHNQDGKKVAFAHGTFNLYTRKSSN